MNPHFYTGCGELFACKREITVVSSVVRAITHETNICSQLVECLGLGFCFQGEGHTGAYFIKMVSAIYLISFQLISLLQTNSV